MLRGFFEQFHFLLRGFFIFRTLPIAVDVDLPGLCVIGIGHWIGGRAFRDRGLFRRGEIRLKLLGDLLCDLSLNSKHVCDIAIVMLSPKMCVAARVD